MPKIKTPRALAYAETDVNYRFKEMAVDALKALIPLAENGSASTSEAAKKAIKAIDALAMVVRKAYINANEAAQDFDVQTVYGGEPASLMGLLYNVSVTQQAMERDLHTRRRSKGARIIGDLAFGLKKDELLTYFGLKEKEEK